MRHSLTTARLPQRRKGAKEDKHAFFASLRLCGSLFLLLTLLVSTACRSTSDNTARGLIIVNSPVTGEVRRVLVREGASVNEGAAIVEIAVINEGQAAATPQPQAEDPQKRAVRSVESANSEIEAARAEVVRTEIEVNRLTPLVASGDAPQAQLDGARADYDRAQQRLRKAQASAQDAQGQLLAARQPQQTNPSQPAPVLPTEQLVTARTSSAGTVSAISIQPGQRVTAGQPLATLRAE